MVYDPEQDFELTPRDHLAMAAPLMNIACIPEAISELTGTPLQDIHFAKHLPLAIARWRYLYADAMLQARAENTKELADRLFERMLQFRRDIRQVQSMPETPL